MVDDGVFQNQNILTLMKTIVELDQKGQLLVFTFNGVTHTSNPLINTVSSVPHPYIYIYSVVVSDCFRSICVNLVVCDLIL